MEEVHGKGLLRQGEGQPIPGTQFLHKIRGVDTEGRFSCQEALMIPGEWVMPHTHTREDEFSFVYRGTAAALIGDEEILASEGSFIFKPRGVPHAMWNPTNESAIVFGFISPAGFEHFFEEMGRIEMAGEANPETFGSVAAKYGEQLNPELIPRVMARLKPGPARE